MGWWGVIALLGACVGICVAVKPPVYSGFLGCRFSRSICQEDEECIDDRLFGSCQKIGTAIDFYQYYLDSGTLQTLEKQIQRLILDGYTWSSVYTQCVLGNILLAFRHDQEPDPYWCDRGGKTDEESQSLTKNSLSLLEHYFRHYYNALTNGDPTAALSDEDSVYINIDRGLPDEYTETTQKKDELIRVHKYFADDIATEDGLAPPKDPDIDTSPYDQLLQQLSSHDLNLLKEYLQQLDTEVRPRLEKPDFRIFDDRNGEINDALSSDTDQLGYVWSGRNQEIPVESAELADTSEDMKRTHTFNQVEDVTLTPSDAKLLGDLLQDKVSILDLTDGEADRLGSIIDHMLAGMEQLKSENSKEIGDDDIISESQVLKDAEMKRTGGIHSAVKKEQMNMDVLGNPSGNSHIHVELAPNDKREDTFVVTPNTGGLNDDAAFPKDPHDYHFNDDMTYPHTNAPKLLAVNEDYTYLQIIPESSDQAAVEHLLEDLERLMDLPQDSFTNLRLDNGGVTFRVNDENINGRDVAEFAKNHVEELRNLTGLTVVNSGIGDEDRVSLDATENGPKYFVLTFVLCGCIAGIVLAVIALYVVRRHSQSKDKLAQLASSGDGTEASKDYQDLCRQRMQSKSSEKPEPLNAAQRVGSVSTSEIRSPSSRSSTSSWSEEPVTSNMDISTGHIVLSYMEDHLKNKDRLDQEWEALCAYEAEPNACTVGAEATKKKKVPTATLR